MEERATTQAELVVFDHPYKVECPGAGTPPDTKTVTAFITHFKSGATCVCCPNLNQFEESTGRCGAGKRDITTAPNCAYERKPFGHEVGEPAPIPTESPAEPSRVIPPETQTRDAPPEGTPIEALSLSHRVCTALKNDGVRTIEDLTRRNENELLSARGFGEASLKEVRKNLKMRGLRLEDW